MYCGQCGHLLDSDARFCPHCGAEQSDLDDLTYTDPNMDDTFLRCS